MDDNEGSSSKTESNSAEINESQNKMLAENVESGNSTKAINGVKKTSQAKPKSKNTPKKSETGYMGLRKGFLL